MATYYADFDLGTGNNDGTSWADAWQTMADAIAGSNGTAPADNDLVYCRGTDTLGASPALNASSTATTGYTKWIGVNGSGVNDGTRTVLDSNGGNWHALSLGGNYNWIENFAFTNTGTTYDGLWGGGDYNVFVNCAAYSCADRGFGSLGTNNIYIRCVAYSNGGDGFNCTTTPQCFLCCSHDNTGHGFALSTTALTYACLAYDNGDDGFNSIGLNGAMLHCVSDGNADDGVVISSGQTTVIGCRITNHSGSGDIGLNYGSGSDYDGAYGWNYFENNDGDNVQNATHALVITEDGAATNVEDQSDTNQGYTSLTDGSEDFNLRSDASLRRVAVQIPLS